MILTGCCGHSCDFAGVTRVSAMSAANDTFDILNFDMCPLRSPMEWMESELSKPIAIGITRSLERKYLSLRFTFLDVTHLGVHANILAPPFLHLLTGDKIIPTYRARG